ncbi:MerR family transcriptional regulator [Lutispora thermophila]|uniref:DNA-binding transcriptional regulator, MerR family n=1 Tax=Lutispora thermophila DSM 19022 TaxID=1122184 RepID=A0A1M6D824_9FIRM|nr:MerR family transcriptional regulator [Lutispora thermophila]SHI69382.1 DNA-binding transcriptional regulator, MerR family [Lutispora thermophila DSM 19022]
MEYTVQKLAKLAGVSSRTLRYYDEIGILKPARINSSGYRIYGQKEVDRFQQIMFYREMDMSLEDIKRILDSPAFNEADALRDHRIKLLEKRQQIDKLIENVEKTIAFLEGRINMSDKEKFEGFKKKKIEDNEKKYGKEAREKYGNEAVDESNKKFMNMTQEDYEKTVKLEKEVKDVLAEAFKTGDPAGELAQRAAELHKQWLTMYWHEYSKEAHAGVAQMYVCDERFRAYYDYMQPGTAEFLRDAILIYTGINK